MNKIGVYRGYVAEYSIDIENGLIEGRVSNISDVIQFSRETVREALEAFTESIDSYIEFCEREGREPEGPYSGKILVRCEPLVHRIMHEAARLEYLSTGEYIGRELKNLIGARIEKGSKKVGKKGGGINEWVVSSDETLEELREREIENVSINSVQAVSGVSELSCSECRGLMEWGRSEHALHRSGKVMLITGIPSWVCGQCGNNYYGSEVVEEMGRVFDNWEASDYADSCVVEWDFISKKEIKG